MEPNRRDHNKNERAGHPKEHTLKFVLAIQQTFAPEGFIALRIESQNEGISDSDVILIVETWLDKVKEQFKKKITDGMAFGAVAA